MTTTHFPLTVRREDVLEIYLGTEPFNFWDPSLRVRWFVLGLSLVLGGIGIVWVQVNSDALVILMLAALGASYSAVEVLRAWEDARKKRRRTLNWVETFIHVPGHEVVVHPKWIAYRRADMEMVFRFAQLQGMHRLPLFFSLSPQGAKDLIIPAKAFAPEDADRFWQLARNLFDQYLAQFTDTVGETGARKGVQPPPDDGSDGAG